MQQVFAMPEKRKKPVILGTDWHTDCDDAVAIRILAWHQWKGCVRLLGVSIDSAMACSAASMRTFLAHERLTGVPVGLDHQATDYGGVTRYQPRLAAGMDWEAENRSCEEAVRLYRRLLAEARQPVTLIEIGFLQVLEALMDSGPDDLSPLSGRELIASRVSELWVMGGRWDGADQPEFNFSKIPRASRAAHRVLEGWPGEVTLLGWEAGCSVYSGGVLERACTWDDALKTVLRDHGAASGRPSWDPLLVWMACLGDPARAGFDTVRGWARANAADGRTHFVPDPAGRHRYVVRRCSDAVYGEQLDRMILGYSRHLHTLEPAPETVLEYKNKKGEKSNETPVHPRPAADAGPGAVGVGPSVL